MGSRTRDERFDVDVSFVDREQKVFSTTLGGDREPAGKVGENSIASEFGRGLDTAAENSCVREIVGVVVVQGFSEVQWLGVKGFGREADSSIRSGGVGRKRESRASGADVGPGGGNVA